MYIDSVEREILGEMREEQSRISEKIVLRDDFSAVERVCGIDVAYIEDTAICALSVFDSHTRMEVAHRTGITRVSFPYVPTYLAFREIPAMTELANSLDRNSDILFVDGNGILHPRGCGLASHLGVKLGIVTIGIAKSLLCGELRSEPKTAGDFSEVIMGDKIIGYGLRTSCSNRLTYVSPGHRISLETALAYATRFLDGKLPTPLRRADRRANELKAKLKN